MQLRPYQTAGAAFLLDTPRSMVLAPVGAGKTAMTLTAIQHALATHAAKRFLGLAPKRVVTDVWLSDPLPHLAEIFWTSAPRAYSLLSR